MTPDYLNHDPQQSGPQYLEDLATGYWFSQVLFTAVEAGVFDLLAGGGLNAAQIAENLRWDPDATARFLYALCALGLLATDRGSYFNTRLAKLYLVKGSENYQGDSILWRRHLMDNWQDLPGCLQSGGWINYPADDESQMAVHIRCYIEAMDNVAWVKAQEIVPLFADLLDHQGEILDVGAGSGALAAGFLSRFPAMQATLVDLEGVLKVARGMMQKRGLDDRTTYCRSNILEPWPLPDKHYSLIILSNIVHAYSEQEIPQILNRAAKVLRPGGYILIHDFFPEHYPAKAALLDLNMFINTYNGRIFPEPWLRNHLAAAGLKSTYLLPLESDTALVIASDQEGALEQLPLDPVERLMPVVEELGFNNVRLLAADQVKVVDWAPLRCRYGCNNYGKPHCPPNSPTPDQTRKVLSDFSRTLLLEGEPPGRDFQLRVLQAEAEAFKAGYHKAFAYWAGNCVLCKECNQDRCQNNRDARPSMEASGIDVFETVRRAGLNINTLTEKDDYVKYYALLLLE